MKPDVSSLIRVAHIICLAAIVTLVALFCVELWACNDPDSMIELRSGVSGSGNSSAVYFRLQNTAKRTINYTFTLRLYTRGEVQESSWSVSICSGSDFQYALHTDAVDGLRNVEVQIIKEGNRDPIRDVTYFLVVDEAAQA